ncbi:Uncharacterised protein [Escherichia coli]|nr:Uncharacterised protein [Escherichia coli]
MQTENTRLNAVLITLTGDGNRYQHRAGRHLAELPEA